MVKQIFTHKIALLLLLCLLMMIPVHAIMELNRERQAYRSQAIHSIMASHSGPQRLMGPVLVQPYTRAVTVEQGGKHFVPGRLLAVVGQPFGLGQAKQVITGFIAQAGTAADGLAQAKQPILGGRVPVERTVDVRKDRCAHALPSTCSSTRVRPSSLSRKPPRRDLSG